MEQSSFEQPLSPEQQVLPQQQQPLRSTTSTIDIYIKLAQYPILSDQIRLRMREEIFKRGVVSE